MIHLTDEHLIGIGRDRKCYRHPEDPELCIKLPKHREKQTRRERCYFTLLRWQKKDTSHLAVYRGMVMTNLGKGAQYDLIRDPNGEISETLTEAIGNNRLTHEQVSTLISELWNYLYSNAICVRDLSPNNLVLQGAPENHKLVIIDGISNPGINPLNFFSQALSRRYLKKKWASMQKKLAKQGIGTE